MRTFRSHMAEAKKPTSLADLAPKHSPAAMDIIRANLGRGIRASATAAATGKPMKRSEAARRERVQAILGRRSGLGSMTTAPRQKAAREAERAARAMGESHTRAELEGLKPSTLRALHKKYTAKGDAESKREAGVIADVLSRVNEQHGGALRSLARANAADLKEYPGKRGERAHKRLHAVIGKYLKRKGKPAPQRPVDEAALKADSATLRKKYEKHEGDLISRMDYAERGRRGDDTPKKKQRIGRRHTAMSLIKREMDRRGEKVGYQFPKPDPQMTAANLEREKQEREHAAWERKQRESNPNYQRNVAKLKARVAAKKAAAKKK